MRAGHSRRSGGDGVTSELAVVAIHAREHGRDRRLNCGTGALGVVFGPGAAKTFRGTADTTAALVRAWSAWLGMRGRTEDFAVFKAWADTCRPRDLFDTFNGVHRVPWESLVRAGLPVDDLIAWFCTIERLGWLKTAHRARFGEPFAILLWRLAAVRPKSLSLRGWQAVAEALGSLLPDSAVAMLGARGFAEGEDLLRAGFGVLAAWEEGGLRTGPGQREPPALKALRRRLEALAPAFFLLRTNEDHAALTFAQLSVAGDVLRFDRGVATLEIQALAKKLDADWPKVVLFCRNNPGQVRHAGDFLAALIETTASGSSAGAQAKSLELVGLSSTALDGLSRILNPKLWTADAWTQLAQMLREAASGARGRFPGSARADLCDLVRHAGLHTRQPLPSDLQFIAKDAMDLTAHEDATVANHAAYAVATIAEWGIGPTDSVLAQDTARTLRAIAMDPRPGVRAAAAYALGYVGRSRHSVMRELVGALTSLANDPYAKVQAEWWLGQRPMTANTAPTQPVSDRTAPRKRNPRKKKRASPS
jgi:hypothetical protein